MIFDLDKVLVGRSAIQRRVRAHVVVEELVLGELGGDVGDGEGAVVAVPELDAGGPVGALDAPVPLGPSRRQDLERDASVLAGALEVGTELAAAVDLDGGDREGHGLDHGLQEALGVVGGGPPEHAGDHVLGGGADGRTRRVRRNLLEGPAVLGVGHVVDLDQLAGGLGLGAVPPSVRPGAVEGPSALGLGPSLAEGRGPDPPVRDGLGEYPTDGRDGQGQPVAGEHRMEPRLAHVGVLLPQLEHGLVVGVRPPPSADAARPGAAGLERLGAAALEGPSPVVVGAPGQADRLERIEAAHAAADHLVDEFEGAQAPFGGAGGLGVDGQALAGRGAGVQQSHVQAPCSLGEPSMPEPAARVSAPPVLELRSLRSLRSRTGATLSQPTGQGLELRREVPKCF